jgi:predicted amidohydrolase
MPDMTDSLIVSAIQWVPEVLDLERGLMRADDAIKEAARNGARLAVFPETWLLGYPYWASLSVRDPRFAVVRRLLQQQAFTRDSQAMQNLQKSAASAGIAIAMGFHESAGGTLFNSVAYIGADGELLNVHRKLMPTNTERLIWGFGDGSDLAPVELDGWKLNGLLCFEHQMALARHALAIDGVDVHAALWPGHAFIDGVIDASTRHIAHENGCFVVVAREIMSVDRLGRHLPDFGDEPVRWVGHGGSAIIGPDGTYLSEPVFDVETIVYAELDLAKIMDAKWLFDGVGHYSRPDVFQLKWDKAPKTPLA